MTTSDISPSAATVATLPLLPMGSTNTVVGLSINGVFLFASSSEYMFDPFFPKAYDQRLLTKKVEVDQCLGSSGSMNTYRYYMYSPCIYEIE